MSNLVSMFNLKEKQEMIKKKLFETINIFKPLVFNIKLKQNYKKKKGKIISRPRNCKKIMNKFINIFKVQSTKVPISINS